MEARWDRTAVTKSLRQIAPRHRIAFAAACAERLQASYERFAAVEGFGDPRILSNALELIWQAAEGQRTGAALPAMLKAVESATPDTEDFESPLASRALDAATAVAQAIDTCLRPTAENAALAAEIAWESAFGWGQSALFGEAGTRIAPDPRALEAWYGELVAAEASVQRESLTALQAEEMTREQVRAFRQRYARDPRRHMDWRSRNAQ